MGRWQIGVSEGDEQQKQHHFPIRASSLCLCFSVGFTIGESILSADMGHGARKGDISFTNG